MKAMDLQVGFGSVKDSYVIAAEEFRQGKQKAQIKQLSMRKAWLIAAVIALMLLLVGCAVVYVLRLQDMRVCEKTITQEAWYGPVGEYVPPTEWVSTQLSLQGYNSSPEQLALREWLDFQAQYDTDYATLINHFYRDCSGNLIEYLRYNTATKMWERETSPEDPDIETWVPITASEANAIQSAYTPFSLDMKPLSQFSMNECVA